MAKDDSARAKRLESWVVDQEEEEEEDDDDALDFSRRIPSSALRALRRLHMDRVVVVEVVAVVVFVASPSRREGC